MKFIKLRKSPGNYIRLNMDLIESYGTINTGKYKGLTFLIPVTMPEDKMPYIVMDSTLEIDKLICRSENAGRIECADDLYADDSGND